MQASIRCRERCPSTHRHWATYQTSRMDLVCTLHAMPVVGLPTNRISLACSIALYRHGKSNQMPKSTGEKVIAPPPTDCDTTRVRFASFLLIRGHFNPVHCCKNSFTLGPNSLYPKKTWVDSVSSKGLEKPRALL